LFYLPEYSDNFNWYWFYQLSVPKWPALAIIAGIFNFISNFAPLIAMIPAVLVALMQSIATAAFVAEMCRNVYSNPGS